MGPSGRLRFRSVWELTDAGSPLDQSLRDAFSQGPMELRSTLADGTLLVTSPLEPPLDGFAIVVVVPGMSNFAQAELWIISIVSLGVAGGPYALMILGACLLLGYRWVDPVKTPGRLSTMAKGRLTSMRNSVQVGAHFFRTSAGSGAGKAPHLRPDLSRAESMFG